MLGYEVGNSACAGVEVIYEFAAGESCKLPCHAVEVVGLLGVGLVERLWSDLEFQVLHEQEDMVIALEELDVLVANGVVALLVVKIHQRGNLREAVGNELQQSLGLLLALAERLLAGAVIMELHYEHPLAGIATPYYNIA